jgi:hypothetical protein
VGEGSSCRTSFSAARRMSAVTGIPDDLYGQEILAGIVLRDGAT